VVAATRASDAAGHVESAIGSAVASLPKLPELQLDDYLPLNCSFGIHQFCVGYRHQQSLSCSSSRFDLAALLPDEIHALPGAVEDALQERIGDLSPLAGDLSSLPTAVLFCVSTGTFCMMVAILVTSCLAFDNSISRKAGAKARVLVHICMFVACSAPYLTLTLLQKNAMDEAGKLPAWVAVERGELFGHSVGLLVCAALFMVLSAIVTWEKAVQWMKERVGARGSVR
jgi:hypothetical protein